MPLRKPDAAYVQKRLALSEKDQDRYFGADPAVRLVFEEWPENTEWAQVLAKVTVLNALYATRIFDVYPVVNRILDLNLDERLRAGDETLVGDLAWVKLGKTHKTLLSFASKYCAWHQTEKFQIFDSRVEWILWEYQKAYRFGDFVRYKLRDYPIFLRAIESFRDSFGLDEFRRKQIDKFLWIEARRAGSNSYAERE